MGKITLTQTSYLNQSLPSPKGEKNGLGGDVKKKKKSKKDAIFVLWALEAIQTQTPGQFSGYLFLR